MSSYFDFLASLEAFSMKIVEALKAAILAQL